MPRIEITRAWGLALTRTKFREQKWPGDLKHCDLIARQVASQVGLRFKTPATIRSPKARTLLHCHYRDKIIYSLMRSKMKYNKISTQHELHRLYIEYLNNWGCNSVRDAVNANEQNKSIATGPFLCEAI